MKNICIVLFMLVNHWAAWSQFKSDEEVKGLAVGAQVENFQLKTIEGEVFDLSEALKKGKVIVIFYRGQWCPYCNRHMAALQDSLDLIQEKGAQIIAIASEKPEVSAQIQKKTGAQFIFLYDEDYKVSQQFDVLFLPSKTTRTMLNSVAKADLKNNYSDDSERLPIPATFIIDQNSTVKWRHFDTNYKNRSTVNEILINL